MAVYTDVAFEDLETLLADYDIGTVTSFKGIAEGVENSNFFLQTDRASFILTLYEKRVRAADLPFFLGLLDHLASHGVACPLPVKSKSGARSATLNGRPPAILTFLDGLSLRRPEPQHCAAAGAALAGLHSSGAGFALRRENSLGLAGWRMLADSTLSGADAVQRALGNLISDSLRELEAHWPRNLPSGVIHADLF